MGGTRGTSHPIIWSRGRLAKQSACIALYYRSLLYVECNGTYSLYLG